MGCDSEECPLSGHLLWVLTYSEYGQYVPGRDVGMVLSKRNQESNLDCPSYNSYPTPSRCFSAAPIKSLQFER